MKRPVFTAALIMAGLSFLISCAPSDESFDDPMSDYQDSYAPSIVRCSPTENETDVSLSTTVTATFIEAMDESTMTADSFSVKDASTDVAGAVSYSDKVITFTPRSVLEANTTFTATITSAATDGAGNALEETFSWDFTTAHLRLVPDTGQTRSFTDTSGEDSDYSINVPSYDDNGDGTITDNVTGLIWQQADDDTFRTPAEAQSYCSSLSLGSNLEWRLPTFKELSSILYFDIDRATTIHDLFTDTEQATYCSSSTSPESNDLKMVIGFEHSLTSTADSSTVCYVRCVSGDSIDEYQVEAKDNGTVLDKISRLVWQKEVGGGMTVDDALTYCENLTLAGEDDWRLPNIKELFSLSNSSAEYSEFPEMDNVVFWSSTGEDESMFINFSFDNLGTSWNDPNDGTRSIRCVRGGENPYFTVSSTSPSNDSFVGLSNVTISATFNRELASSTITTDSFTVNDGTSNIAGTVSYADKTATFQPAADLTEATTFTATVTTDITDENGIALKQDYSWEFETVEEQRVTDTGQTTSYATSFGDDADYSINTPSFTDNGNGTITDNVTGLVWQKEDDGGGRNYSDAVSYCQDLSLGSISNWRMPGKQELQGIINYGNSSPAAFTAYFTNTKSEVYWSEAFLTNDTDDIVFTFNDGSTTSISPNSLDYVRCVSGNSRQFHFIDNGDETVSDAVTGLMWQKDGVNSENNWEAAIEFCENLSLAGHTDWRLPTIKELQSIVNYSQGENAIDSTYFQQSDDGYWHSFYSSTPANASQIWYMDTDASGRGNVQLTDTSNDKSMRCVRAGNND